ncbi:MAG: hypothetical protein N2513_07695 [Deltaproteobacteria bacterium]|nr:hypothetical protein [Deltaproteobacteria bacterium]
MKTKLILVFLAFTVVMFYVSMDVFSVEKHQPGSKKKITVNQGLYLHGKVVSINSEAKLMSVKSSRGDVTLDITNASLKGYKGIKEISVGDKVKVRYTNFGIEIVKTQK